MVEIRLWLLLLYCKTQKGSMWYRNKTIRLLFLYCKREKDSTVYGIEICLYDCYFSYTYCLHDALFVEVVVKCLLLMLRLNDLMCLSTLLFAIYILPCRQEAPPTGIQAVRQAGCLPSQGTPWLVGWVGRRQIIWMACLWNIVIGECEGSLACMSLVLFFSFLFFLKSGRLKVSQR